ncbi:MAG: DUF2190 family protein [Betaproteobacteria bacterium]|nr:DUF2190 family protein [Betaproteobacteria bacterium]
MATNYIGDGDTINWALVAAATSGDFLQFPTTGTGMKFVGVVKESGVTGDVVAVALRGIWSVSTKVAAAGAWAVGDDIYITPTGDFTETATANGYAGVAAEAAVTGATTGKIIINFGGDPR